MRNFIRRIFCTGVLITYIFLQNVNGQTIIGDTIFVNTEAEVAIKFPSKLSNFYTTPNNAPYNLKTISSGLTISSKSENTRPGFLFVTEGGRTHHIVLAFKKDINYDNEAELFLDYGTLKKLEEHVQELAARKKAKSTQVAIKSPGVKNIVEKTIPVKAVVDTPAQPDTYTALLEEGDKNLKLGLYKEAKVIFEDAHTKRPDDIVPTQRLEEIQLKINNSEVLAEIEKNKKYIELTERAKTDFDQKNYKEAQDGYKQALALKANDLYATRQLEKIDQALYEENQQKERLKMQDVYRSYMLNGEIALNKNNLAEASSAFEQALVVIPSDTLAAKRLAVVQTAMHTKEQELRQKDTVESNYNYWITEADKAFQAGDYAAGKALYNKARLVSKLPKAADQINRIDKLIADEASKDAANKKELAKREVDDKKDREMQELEYNYAAAVQSADKLFNDGNLAKAKLAYNDALQIINRPWPKEQIKKINTLVADQVLREKNEKQQLEIRLAREKKENEALALENKYNAAIQTGDKFFNDGKLAEAKTAYINAKQIINLPWPNEQITKINARVTEQALREKNEKQQLALNLEREKKENEALALENKYSAVILIADNFFKAENYSDAKIAYKVAMAIIKKPWPAEQLENISKIETDRATAELTDRPRIMQEKIAAKYTAAVKVADIEFDHGNFVKARKLYADAGLLMPAETYPKERLNYIQTTLDRIAAEEKEQKETLAVAAEQRKRYENAIAKAKAYYLKEDLVNAQSAYTEAAALNSDETEPKDQLKLISDKLAEIERQNEITRRYESKLAFADSLLIAKKYDYAIGGYQDALNIKPSEVYPDSQIKYIQAEVSFQRKQKEDREKLDAHNLQIEKRKKYRHLVILGDKSVVDNNLETAKQQYTEALNLQPEDDYAKQRLKIVSYQLDIKKNLAEKANTVKP